MAELILAPEAITMAVACTAAEAVGDAVYLSGPSAVRRCDPYDAARMPAIGVVAAKASTTACMVITAGRARTVGLTPGAAYFVAPSGAAAPGTPSAGPGPVFVQRVGRAVSSTILSVAIEPPTRKLP